MSHWLSRPFESLRLPAASRRFDTVIVGSGYGAAMSALALAMRRYRSHDSREILVIERGLERLPGDFPKTISDLAGQVSVQGNGARRTGTADALFDMRAGENVNVIVGSGLGGTSLINAGVAVDPDADTLAALPPWEAGQDDWLTRLAPSLTFVRELLGVRAHPRGDSLPKVAALAKLAKAMSCQHALADIAVSFADADNRVGVRQTACNDCGNCFTGCNTGAKNTLAVNAWPLARRLGVDIVTGGEVSHVRAPADGTGDWTLFAHETREVGGGDGMPPLELLEISARRVILAAGTLGSTEILARSKVRATVTSSGCIGERFSLNGDGIAFGFGQKSEVRGCASVPSSRDVTPGADQRPGPTIVSRITVAKAAAGERSGLIEDATIPQPIARMWAEVLSTQAQFRRFGEKGVSAWHDARPKTDPLVVTDDLMCHHQSVLLMATEKGDVGRLDFDGELDQLGVHWPGRPPKPQPDPSTMTWFDGLLGKAGRKGFDGGLFLSSPFWRPLPADFENVFEGAGNIGGANLCNHPLGGCVMAADASRGVVNRAGQVFSRESGDEVHPNLFVLDGAIIPEALGINPYMTIAALAHYLALRMDGTPRPEDYQLPDAVPEVVPEASGSRGAWPVPVLAFDLIERLFGPADTGEAKALADLLGVRNLAGVEDGMTRGPGSLAPRNTFALDVKVRFPDIHAYLEEPSIPLKARFTLYRNVNWQKTIHTVPDEFLGPKLGEAEGEVTLFGRDTKWYSKTYRAALAVLRFIKLRGDEISSGDMGGDGNWWKKIAGFARVARQHARWRYLRYEVQMPIGGKSFSITGAKRLAYDGSSGRTRRDEANPWISLTNLRLEFRESSSRKSAQALFHVDLLRMSDELAALQTTSGAETPHVVSAMARFGGLVLRCLLQTQLWTFGAPSYDDFPTQEKLEEEFKPFAVPEKIDYDAAAGPVSFDVGTAKSAGSSLEDRWRLLFAQGRRLEGVVPRPVMLVHGLAHSSEVFHTHALKRNLAGHLLYQGFDVYLLDHGLSTGLENPKDHRPSVEQVSRQVTRAIQFIYENYAETPTRVGVFAHCVGSAATTMSILGDGRMLFDGDTPMIERLAMHAVPPWICASEANVVRAYISVYFRNKFFPDEIDPIPRKQTPRSKPDAAQNLLDRLGSSIPWTSGEFQRHDLKDAFGKLGRTVCNRMTLFYGYDWAHRNLGGPVHHALPGMMGAVNSDAYRQLYFLVKRGRVTDALGRNKFVQAERFVDFWQFPTFFLHGDDNETFNYESSVLSAWLLGNVGNLRAQRGRGAAQSVDLKLFEKYGHLDALIGQNADRDVFPTISDYFHAKQLPSQTILPRLPVTAPGFPATGPIISHPRKMNGTAVVRIWVETNEFQTSRTREVKFVRLDGSFLPLPVEWHRSLENWQAPGLAKQSQRDDDYYNLLGNSLFWLADVDCRHLTCPLAVRVIADDARLPTPLLPNNLSRSSFSIHGSPQPEMAAHAPAYSDPPGAIMDWTRLPWFRRFIDDSYVGVSFILGSCWYPGSWFDQDAATAVFTKIRAHVESQEGIDHLLLVGDQIYADASYSIFDIREDRERYQESHRHAFRSELASWVLRHVPTYFAVDDHEFRDGFPKPLRGETAKEFTALADAARLEAWNFQMHHGHWPARSYAARNNALWQEFRSAGYDFFLFDTRSERCLVPPRNGNRLLGDQQIVAFKDWAGRLADLTRPVFIATGSPLAPLPRDEVTHPALALSSDTLRAYPEFVNLLVETFHDIGFTGRVILLCGDPHYSSMCEATLTAAGLDLGIVCIVSSGVNIPLPFVNDDPGRVDWHSAQQRFDFPLAQGTSVTMRNPMLLSTAMRHVLRIDLAPDHSGYRLDVSVVAVDAAAEKQITLRL